MTDSDARLERRYRRLLALYPRSYREQHGEDLLGVLMAGAAGRRDHPGFMERLDLLHSAVSVHARYWWEMRVARDRNSWAVRHPRAVVRVRLAVALWLTFVTVMLCVAGYWWLAAPVAFFIGLHLLFASRAASHGWPPDGGPAADA
jgi:hypothetical protein